MTTSSYAPIGALPAALALVAGMVDVTGWLTLGGLFTAHITGNLVVMAADFVAGRGMHATQVVAVPLFVVVAACIGVGVRASRVAPRRLEMILLTVQAVFLVAAAMVSTIASPSHDPFGPGAVVVVVLAVAAMAAQNTLLHLSRYPAPTTGVMTGNVVVCVLSLVSVIMARADDIDIARDRWRDTWPILACFLIGCGSGAGAVLLWKDAGWFAAAAASFAVWLHGRGSPWISTKMPDSSERPGQVHGAGRS